MEALDGIIAKSRQESKNMTTTKSKEHKCPLCKYTGFVLEYREHLQPLAKECSCKVNRDIERAWSEFGVKPSQAKRISEYKPYDKLTENAKKKVVDYILNFENKKKNNLFLLMGQPGAGKSLE